MLPKKYTFLNNYMSTAYNRPYFEQFQRYNVYSFKRKIFPPPPKTYSIGKFWYISKHRHYCDLKVCSIYTHNIAGLCW